jgi:60 kDa SS-A/Ro ribonucleoprotein
MSSYSVLSDVLAGSTDASPITGQMAPIPGKESIMALNKAGGYTFKVSDEDYILRCLILGTNKNTYYSTAREMTAECIDFLKQMIKDGKGSLLVDTIKKVYEDGRAPKQDPTLMALALASSCEDLDTRKKAYKVVSTLRTFSHIYTWKGYHKVAAKSKGMGKLSKAALCALFEKMTPQQLGYQVTKYPHRKTAVEDWSFLDLMRCIHLKGDKLPLEGQFVLKYAVRGVEESNKFLTEHPELKDSHVIKYIQAVEKVKALTDSEDNRVELIKLTYEFNLPREVMPTWAFCHADVWRALLLNREQTRVVMPMTALIRNLAVMTARDVFTDALTVSLVEEHLTNEAVIKKARLHPVNILIAMMTYKSGHGEKGKLTWTPHAKIVAALEQAFYKSFKYVKATGKRIFHGIDCSGSMTSPIPCLPQISSHTAASVMAMTFARIEAESAQEFVGFTAAHGYYGRPPVESTNDGLRKLEIKPTMSLEQAMKVTQFSDFGSTDCSLPVEKAIKDFKVSGGTKGLWDVFMIYTDNETYAGRRHPSEALKEYRELTGIPAKMVVIACMPTASTIADPTDGGMLDVVGFDTNAPEIVMNFIRGDALDDGLEAGPVVAEDE